MRTLFICCFLCFACVDGIAQPAHKKTTPTKNGYVKITFKNTINGQPVVLNDSVYTNPFRETYRIKKLKYYISNFQFSLVSIKKIVPVKQCFLINQADDSSLSITLEVPATRYDEMGFLLGVDSVLNTSGAQTGALDPLNDMFWTWHSGYIMQKLEGTSPQSNIVNNKFEYHIGGYEGESSVLQTIWLNHAISVEKGKTTSIIINADIGKYWNAAYPVKISETPVCSTPGALAKKLAGNFSTVFSIADVIQ